MGKEEDLEDSLVYETEPAPKIVGEKVNHPKHYNRGSIEVIDAIEDWGLGFNLGNVVKYLSRADHKSDDPMIDLLKAHWYLEREISNRKAVKKKR